MAVMAKFTHFLAIVDTGFNGWLSLPPDLIAQLNLRWKMNGYQLVVQVFPGGLVELSKVTPV